jgi:hypothetical protein
MGVKKLLLSMVIAHTVLARSANAWIAGLSASCTDRIDYLRQRTLEEKTIQMSSLGPSSTTCKKSQFGPKWSGERLVAFHLKNLSLSGARMCFG